MIKIFGRHTSYNVQKVLWFLEELAIEFDHIELGGRFGGIDTPEFSELNPHQKVPVLVDNGNSIWESNTILRYLLLTYGAGKWCVGDPYERSKYERWMDWSIDRMEQAFVGVFWGYYRTPQEARNMGEVNKQLALCNTYLLDLDKALDRKDFLCGSQISLADISIGVFMYRLVEMGLGVKLPKNTSRWYDKMAESKGYRKWVMSDFSELAGRVIN